VTITACTGTILDGPRAGRTLSLPLPPPQTINFPYAHDTSPVPIGGTVATTVPEPLPVPESYQLEGRSETGRYEYRYVPAVTL
jgi:hypothetical protein